ncbi:MAG: VWA domain-containing protein [Planctomycetota bacterium]
MLFERPLALLLLLAAPLIALSLWRARAFFDSAAHRTAVIGAGTLGFAALVIALAGPWARTTRGRPTRTVIARGDDATLARQWREATPARDAFQVIAAGETVAVGPRGRTEVPQSAGDPDLGAALGAAIALSPDGGDVLFTGEAGDAGRIFGHESLDVLTAQAKAAGIRIHARTTPVVRSGPALLEVKHVGRVHVGEAFRLEATIDVPGDVAVRVEVRSTDDDALLGARELALSAGTNHVSVDVAPGTRRGVLALDTRVMVGDAKVSAERSALLCDGAVHATWMGATEVEYSALRDTLAPFGIDLRHGDVAASSLDDTDVVVVDDLPASAWSEAAQGALAAAIPSRGVGLLLAGAWRNLGPGGYAQSPLAPLLPVDMPQREERRDPSCSLVVVIDTSGSMGSRIDLAKEVARLAIRRLMPHDKVGIVEFYGSKRWAAPLQPASNLIELMRALDRMQAGGGTVIYSALEESYYALLNARTRFKHILVLTDGGVESGPFEELARRIADANMQLSTVLIGPQAQSDFLMDLAQWGGGRFYACPSRFQLPDLRFKEPQTTRLPAVREERIAAEASAGRETAAALRDGDAVELGGLVEAAPKPWAERIVDAPGGSSVLAAWDQGAGRVATLATELLGPLTDTARGTRWSGFLADQIRALARGHEGAQPELRVEPSRASVRIELRGADPSTPRMLRVVQSDGGAREIALATGPEGSLSTTMVWPDDRPCRFQVVGLDAAAAAVRPAPRDGRLDDRSTTLRALALATGGTTEGLLPVEPPPAAQSGHRSLTPTFALAGLVGFLLLLVTRRWPRGATRAAAALLAVLLTLHTSPAQEDPAAAARIAQQIRDVGDLEPLVAEWKDGTPAQKLALAQARGDLQQVIALTADATDIATRVRRALALDATGRLDEAVAVLAALASDGDAPAELRQEATLHRAELLAAKGDKTAAEQAFRDAARDASPAMRRAIGHLAGGLGMFDVALDLHVDDDTLPAAARCCVHLRRGAWFETLHDDEASRREYHAAATVATLQRERAFALSRELGLARDEAALRAFAAGIRNELASASTVEIEAMLDALRACGDGDAILGLLDEPAVRSNPAVQSDIVAIAVECGRADRAVEESKRRLTADPHDHRLRVSLALLLTDLQRKDEARATLLEGIAIGSHKELLALTQAAGELFEDVARDEGLARLKASESEAERIDGVMLEIELLRARHRDADAAKLALDARSAAKERSSRARLAGMLESLGRNEEAIELLRDIQKEHPAEDVALRLAWLLSQGKTDAQRTESRNLFREVWLTAGSPARRVQAQERVLDAAARDGSLADLAIELEAAVADPSTQNRDSCRDALVKIWTRAQDTFGARDVLLQWAKEQPEHEIDAWQAIAQACLETDDYRGQERALRHLMEIDPENAMDYRQQLVLAFLERGRAAEARAVIRELLAKEGESDAVTYEFSAGIYALAGKPRDAARLYRRAYAAHPDRIETLLLWANAMQSQQRGAEAIGLFLDLIAQDVPDDLFLVAVDGLLNLSAGSEALRFAERAVRRRIAASPDRVFLQRALQDVLEQLGDKDGRLAVLEETVLIAGQQRSAWLREAMEEASQRKDWTRYLVHARSLLRSGEEVPPTVFVEMGEALLAAKDLPGAERAFARARLAPDFAAIEHRIAKAYESARRFDDAERILRRALRRAPDDPEAMFAIAALCEQRGARSDALDLWRRGAIALIHGEVFASSNAPQRGFNRNQRSEGPGVDTAISGVLRTADSGTDVVPVRDAVLARLDGREKLEDSARRTLAGRLRNFADAFPDTQATARAREVEDGLLGEEKLDGRMRRDLILEGIRRFEITRLLALPEKAFDGVPTERVRALLLAGDLDHAAERIAALEPQTLELPVRWLTALGAVQLRDAAVARLREAAATDPRKAGRTWLRVAPLVGEKADERAILDAELADALAAAGTGRVKAGRLLAALRADRSLPQEQRAVHARKLVEMTVEAGDANLAFTVLEAARDWLPAADLAVLVPLSFKKPSSAYLISSRCKYLRLLPIDDAESLLRDTLRAFGDEGRMPLLQALANGAFSGELATRAVDLLGKGKFTTSDSIWLTRLATSKQADRSVLQAMARLMLRVAPEDPCRPLLDLRASDDAGERMSAVDELIKSLLAANTVDYSWCQLAEAVVATTNPAMRRDALAAIQPGAGPANLLLRATLESSLGRSAEAAEHAEAAALASPENMSIQSQSVTMLGLIGRTDAIVRIYKRWLDVANEVYPFQVAQLAQVMLTRGDAMAAIEALDRTKDDYGYTDRVRLRAALMLTDPQTREREIARWAQSTHRTRVMAGSAGPGGVMLISRALGRVGNEQTRITIEDVLKTPDWPRYDVEGSPLTSDEIERLGSVPEGRRILEELIRKSGPAARLTETEHYRGLLRAERSFGDVIKMVGEAQARFDADHGDAHARGILWAAIQIGLPVREDLVELLLHQRILLADQNQGELVELCWTALQVGRDVDVDRMLDSLLADRNTLNQVPDDDTGLGGLLRLAAQRRPDALRGLAPTDSVDPQTDSWLLALALDSDEPTASIRERFAAVRTRLDDPEASYQALRLALPWAGLDVRDGNLDAALRDLEVEDNSLERSDDFPAAVFAQAIPPLSRWSKPELATDLAARIAAAVKDESRVERRFLLLRLAGLLAHRLDAAGRGEDAERVRGMFAAEIAALPDLADWFAAAKR